MTATSTLTPNATPSAMTRSWNQAQRIVALFFVIAAFVVVAFVVGRATVHTHSGTSVPASTSSVSAVPPCRVGPC